MNDLQTDCPAGTEMVRSVALRNRRSIQTEIGRFQPEYRPAIRVLADRSPRIADLINSFPGLLFALSQQCATDKRNEACRLIEAGAPLRSAAQVVGVPFWLRRLMPEAFTEPIGPLPSGPAFERSVGNYIPQSAWGQGLWLTFVSMAQQLGGDEFAQWTAQHSFARLSRERQLRWVWVMAYAWTSAHPDTPAYQLLNRPFAKTLSLARVQAEIDGWLNRLHLTVALGDTAAGDAPLAQWIKGGTSLGYQIVPLTSVHDFITEAQAMRNCLDRYGPALTRGHLRIVSIRKQGVPVADFELVPHEHDASVPTIRQLRSTGNARAEAEHWRAALSWLGRQALPRLPPGIPCFGPRCQKERQRTCKALLAPFIATARTPRQRRLIDEALTMARLTPVKSF